jgi:hypothetical protein
VAEKIPSWPKVTIRLYDDHNAEVKIAGRSHPVNHHDPRQAAIALVSERASQLGRAVKATAVESDGASWPLVIHPDGRVEAIDTETRGKGKGKGGDKPIWPIIVAAVVAGALVIGTVLYLTVLSPGESVPKSTASPKLPPLPEPKVGPDQFVGRPAPLGWSANASWTVDIADDTVPAVKPDGTEVAVLTPDDKIAVFDSDGKVLWQDKVPSDAESPVYTTIDSKPVLAVVSSDTLYYWAGDGAEATEIELPDSAQVQFFGTSPLVQMGTAGASVVSGGELKTVPNQPRSSTILLAEGDKALMARYEGPLYWSQPGKDRVEVGLKPPKGAKGIDHVVAASPGLALVLWKTANTSTVIPTVHSTVNGSAVATCQAVSTSDLDTWDWVPDATGKVVAAWGECLINFTSGKTIYYPDFKPQSITGATIYGVADGKQVAITPGKKSYVLPSDTARPWGIVGSHAIVVHDSVVFALDKKK